MTLVWATRGRTWGHRFLLDGGFADPLPVYDRVFFHVGDGREAYVQTGDKVALRFPDLLNRKDLAGRVIIHEFVVGAPLAAQVTSVTAGIRLVWDLPGIADRYAKIWDLSDPDATGADEQ